MSLFFNRDGSGLKCGSQPDAGTPSSVKNFTSSPRPHPKSRKLVSSFAKPVWNSTLAGNESALLPMAVI